MSKTPNFLYLIPLNTGLGEFSNSGPVTFFTLLAPNFMQSFRKNNELSLEIFNDQPWTDKNPLLRIPSGKAEVQNYITYLVLNYILKYAMN